MGKFSGYLICSDYDGTFATGGQPVSENLEAVRYFTENGGCFTIATGRMVDFMRDKNIHTLINAPASLCNGSVVYDYREEKVLRQRYLPYTIGEFVKCVAPMVHLMTGMNVFWDVTCGSVLYEKLSEAEKAHKDTQLLKLLCKFSCEEDADAFRNFVVQQPLMEKCYISKSWRVGVEFNAKDASKGHSLEFIKEYLGNIHTTIGVGNYENDIPLLTHADIGAAPMGSLEAVLQQADMILAPCGEGAIRDLIVKLEKNL